jgi:fatty acid desaturase
MTATTQTSTEAARRWRVALTRDEIASLKAMQDWHSWLTIIVNWGIVFGAMALVAAWPNVFTIVLALFLIGARQLGMAVVMHEASHGTLLRKRSWNDWVGNWLGAYPVWGDLEPYRPYHLQHHAMTWTEKDPDLTLAKPFPITRASLRRKIWRDLSGQTGWKRARATLRRDLGFSQGKVQRRKGAGWQQLKGPLIANGVLFGILAAAGHPALYLLWAVAWLTTYSLVMRIRSIAEHSMPSDPASELGNTRTTRASWWERLFIAPNGVNYHLEHHLLMSVPHYHLPRMHRLLAERGALDDALLAPSYWSVLSEASSRA